MKIILNMDQYHDFNNKQRNTLKISKYNKYEINSLTIKLICTRIKYILLIYA